MSQFEADARAVLKIVSHHRQAGHDCALMGELATEALARADRPWLGMTTEDWNREWGAYVDRTSWYLPAFLLLIVVAVAGATAWNTLT